MWAVSIKASVDVFAVSRYITVWAISRYVNVWAVSRKASVDVVCRYVAVWAVSSMWIFWLFYQVRGRVGRLFGYVDCFQIREFVCCF